jgi:hypothetical protein
MILKAVKRKLDYLDGGRFKREERDLKIHFGGTGADIQLLSLLR